MEEKFVFRIHGVEKINYNDLNDVITSIQWSYHFFLKDADRNALRTVNGFYLLDLPNPENFVEISNITADVLKNWMINNSTSLSQKLDINAIEQRLRFMMNSDILPTFSGMIEGLDKLNP